MRLFIGLQPTGDFLRALARVQDDLRAVIVGGRWYDIDGLHLTLAFIGEWPGEAESCLPEVPDPFPIVLSHIGIFPKAKVLWAGVEPSGPLEALAARTRQGLAAAGIPFDAQPFVAHITLARKPVLPYADCLSEIEVPRVSMMVRETCLYQSVRVASAMRYTVIGRSEGTGACAAAKSTEEGESRLTFC